MSRWSMLINTSYSFMKHEWQVRLKGTMTKEGPWDEYKIRLGDKQSCKGEIESAIAKNF